MMRENVKVLFLDIDGVLNSRRSAYAFGGFPHDFSPSSMALFDSVSVALIRRLCKETGASIVLSSSWRIIHKVEECANGLDLPIIDRTPNLSASRGTEINAWLWAHPEVTRYAIVDDDSDILPDQMPFFVQTAFKNGLLMDDYERLNHLLSGEPMPLIWVPVAALDEAE